MLERLAAAAVIVVAICSGVYFITKLETRVEKLEALIPVQVSAMPSGTMLPYVGSQGTADQPDGWVLCGSADTPEMDGRFLIGTNEAGQVGTATGSADHSHGADFKTSLEVDGRRGGPEGADNYTGSPNWNHKHQVEGNTQPAKHLPPSVKVLFFCKQ